LNKLETYIKEMGGGVRERHELRKGFSREEKKDNEREN
jgi:hypothetical protein